MPASSRPPWLAIALGLCAWLGAAAHAARGMQAELPAPFDASAIDRSADACRNFFAYATGRYRAAHPIPREYTEYGYIEELVDRTRDIVRDIIVRAQHDPGPTGGNAENIGTFYATCMDTSTIERQGLTPIAPELTRIAAIGSRADLARFDTRARCVIDQFDRTVAVGSVHYQGRLVSGEAIADLGGLVIGYRALESAPAGPRADGFTPEQRYFLAFAQSWSEEVRPQAARTQALGDPHPLPRDRINQTVANVPAWYAAFNCGPAPKRVCQVW